jgi:hypothetical protein
MKRQKNYSLTHSLTHSLTPQEKGKDKKHLSMHISPIYRYYGSVLSKHNYINIVSNHCNFQINTVFHLSNRINKLFKQKKLPKVRC